VATATSGNNYGVYGQNVSEVGGGVRGIGSGTSCKGVFGTATSSQGFTYGGRFESFSPSGRGVHGEATATTGQNYGVYGKSNSTDGYGVYYAGGIGGSSLMRNMVRTQQGPVELYAQQATENWFEDFGEGQLQKGTCYIDLDPLFLETVTIDADNPMKVFITPDDPACKGVAVVRGRTGFEVIELHNGVGNSQFAYRVVAKRKGFEDKRLDYCKAAQSDSYLYPELREKGLQEQEEERALIEEQQKRMEDEKRRMEVERERRVEERERLNLSG
jgi:hypothetical protein